MKTLQISAANLINSLLQISKTEQVCILDSCGVSYLDSHLLIAGIKPIETFEITNEEAEETLKIFNQKLALPDTAYFFTISYDFGLKLEKIKSRKKKFETFSEPDIFLAQFDCLIIHNYKTGDTFLKRNEERFDEIEALLRKQTRLIQTDTQEKSMVQSNFTRQTYICAVEKIQEFIRSGDTYQTNLTQQFRAELPQSLTPQSIFWRLRSSHPASFSAFIKRKNDSVVSISPERFLKVKNGIITTSPIKGTRPRGENFDDDLRLKNDLLNSEKDRAENVMIVDLLRNDIGRICEFGSVHVEKLCDLEIHPTLFHLVSTINGTLRNKVNFADIIRAVFPCGSITGAPKIRTMQIINEIETANRGLSMGAIGYCGFDKTFDLSVAIRTMVIRETKAIFNVGGGIVIDSIANDEYEESLLKAKALLKAINAEIYEP